MKISIFILLLLFILILPSPSKPANIIISFRSSGGSHGGRSGGGSSGGSSSGGHSGGTTGSHTEGGSTSTGGTHTGTTTTGTNAGGAHPGTTTPTTGGTTPTGTSSTGGATSTGGTTAAGTSGTHTTGTTGTHTTGTHTGNTSTSSSSRSNSSSNRNNSSFLGWIAGILLFFMSFPLLWYNEKRGVRMAKIIDEGLKECVEVNDGRCIKETEGLLICLHGEISTEDSLVDNVVGVSVPHGIKMVRKVEILQYVEQKVHDDEFNYKKEWVNDLTDSSNFHEEIHRNKNEIKSNKSIWNQVFYANEMKIGDYLLNNDLKEEMKCEERLNITENMLNLDEIKSKTNKQNIEIHDNMLYILRKDFVKPKIGDIRIHYEYLKAPRAYTVIARQRTNVLEPYYGKNVERPQVAVELSSKESERSDMENKLIEKPHEKTENKGIVKTIRDFMDDSIKINWLFEGNQPLSQCFEIKMKQEQKITWILRLVGFLCMTFGVYMFFAPLLALTNWIPILGTVIAFIFFLFSLSVGLSLSLLTISIAWFFYRPLIGGFMIGGSVLLYILTVVVI